MHHDIVILSGGVSKGDADYIPAVLQDCGVSEIFHKVKIKPGNPLWFGATQKGTVVFGLPGNPVAVQVSCKIFIEPYLRKCFQSAQIQPIYLPLFEKKKKRTKLDEFFPCQLSNKNNSTGLQPCRMNGSGDVAALIASDGIALHPTDQEELQAFDHIQFYSWT